MRELRLPPRPVFRAAFAAATATVWTLAGPFGTFTEMRLSERALYFALAIGAGAALYGLALWAMAASTRLSDLPPLARVPLAALAIALPAGLAVALVDQAIRGGPLDLAWHIAVTCTVATILGGVEHAVSLGLSTMAEEIARSRPAPPAGEGAPPPGDAFLRRLPPGIGRDLVSLTMQDHYVRATTRVGSAMILMRFADALDELRGYPGLRVHRSHWVARRAVTGLDREGRRPLLVLVDERRLPVSRTHLDEVRRAVGRPYDDRGSLAVARDARSVRSKEASS